MSLRHKFLTALTLVLFAPAAHAQEFVYSPEGCDFRLTFPGEPHAVRRCHDKLTDKCDLMTSYTQVFELDATVNFYVSCKPSPENFRKDFSTDLLRTSLLARPNVDLLEVYDISFNETDEALMGALMGAGRSPSRNDEMVYVTQIWVGNNSVLTFEGEMVGVQKEEVDQLFADVLASMRHKDWPEQQKTEKPAAETTPPAPDTPSESAPAPEKPAEKAQEP